MNDFDHISAVGSLADSVRRALYEFVVGRAEPVGREEAAAGVDVPLHTAKFHLDRLVADGLLEGDYRRLSGKSGPGAGRPAKVYQRARTPIDVSLPGRRYSLVGGILASAIERADDSPELGQALQTVAHEAGAQNAELRRGDREPGSSSGSEAARVAEVLAHDGYEPVTEGSQVRLRNCPFDELARRHRDLVCGINHSYVQGVLEGLRCSEACAEPETEDGYCCVRVTNAEQSTAE